MDHFNCKFLFRVYRSCFPDYTKGSLSKHFTKTIVYLVIGIIQGLCEKFVAFYFYARVIFNPCSWPVPRRMKVTSHCRRMLRETVKLRMVLPFLLFLQQPLIFAATKGDSCGEFVCLHHHAHYRSRPYRI